VSVAVSAGPAKGNTVAAVAVAVVVAIFGKLRRRTARKMQTAGPAVALVVDELGRSEDLAVVLETSKDQSY
jgi:MYXO-CTERM domain-containing protein